MQLENTRVKHAELKARARPEAGRHPPVLPNARIRRLALDRAFGFPLELPPYAGVMVLHFAICAGLFLVGAWLLFYAERLQKYATLFHERRKRTHLASNFFLKATRLNYELMLRFIGGFLMALALFLVIRIAADPMNWR